MDLLVKLGAFAGINNVEDIYLAIQDNNPLVIELIICRDEFSPLLDIIPAVAEKLPKHQGETTVFESGYSFEEKKMLENFANELNASWETVEKGLKERDNYYCEMAQALEYEKLLEVIPPQNDKKGLASVLINNTSLVAKQGFFSLSQDINKASQKQLEKDIKELAYSMAIDYEEALKLLNERDLVILLTAEDFGFTSVLEHYPPLFDDGQALNINQ